MVVTVSDVPSPIPLPCTLAFPPPSHRDATTPSPCWAPHFMTQERIMFSNPTPSKPRLSPAATMSDATPSALTPPFRLVCPSGWDNLPASFSKWDNLPASFSKCSNGYRIFRVVVCAVEGTFCTVLISMRMLVSTSRSHLT